MSVKDDLNKGFTVGDVTTVNYDDEARIKVKDFYELDKLERTKTLDIPASRSNTTAQAPLAQTKGIKDPRALPALSTNDRAARWGLLELHALHRYRNLGQQNKCCSLRRRRIARNRPQKPSLNILPRRKLRKSERTRWRSASQGL